MAGYLRDALCKSKCCQLPHNYRSKLYNKSTTKRSDGVKGLQLTDVQWTAAKRLPSWVSSTTSTVDEFRWQHGRLAVAKFAKSRVKDKLVSGGSNQMLAVPNFLITQRGINGSLRAKSQRPVLPNILRQSYNNAKVTIDLRQASNLQNILQKNARHFSGTIHSHNCKTVFVYLLTIFWREIFSTF